MHVEFEELTIFNEESMSLKKDWKIKKRVFFQIMTKRQKKTC